jgi:5-enolpyruvylshikimate-3-phosphate synthase
MALSVLLTAIGGEIDGAESVSKSYPEFFNGLLQLGIDLEIKN